jgi:metallophosphoesterase (TIGR00282 family)
LDITLLCIGDVVGKPGRSALAHWIPRLVKERAVDCVIANVENAAAGSGLTELLYQKFLRYGVDAMTMGDHIYRKAEILPTLQKSDRIVRPANFPAESVGHEVVVVEARNGVKVAVASVIGRLFMKGPADCPFHAVDRILGKIPADVRIRVVDVHAEATSEKVAMGWHLDGRASVVYGTHTHVQTADERVLEGGTAYITDLGMSGPHDGVLGRKRDRVLKSLITGMPSPFDVCSGDVRMCGILVRVDADTGRARSIERIALSGPQDGQSDERD